MTTMDCIKQTSLKTSNKLFAGRLHKLTKVSYVRKQIRICQNLHFFLFSTIFDKLSDC